MTGKDLKMTSEDKKDKIVSKKVKSKNHWKGGDKNAVTPSNGRDLINQRFSSQ